MSVQTAIQRPVPLRHLRQTLAAHKRLLDLTAALALGCAVLALYAATTGSGVLDGDQGEFQYMPAVLGIPHPSGFPLYLLLGHLWSGLPIGTLAYRMNLFSGFWGATTVVALYLVLRWQKVHPIAAFAASAALAVVPQFWQYSTVAAVYRLHNFLIVFAFCMLAQWERTHADRWLHYAALAVGLDLATHLTIVFFAPFTLLLLVLVAGRRLYREPRLVLVSAGYLVAPLLLYLYFPIRGAQLASPPLLSGLPENVARGIVSPFFSNTPAGLWSYFVGGSFYGAVTGHWQWTIDKLIVNFLPTVLQTINWPLALFGLLGAVVLFRRRPRLATWLAGNALLLLVLAVQYTSLGLEAIGQLSSYAREYYLPAFILLIVLAAYGLDALLRIPSSFTIPHSSFIRPVVLLAVILFMGWTIADLASHHSDALIARSAQVQIKWDSIKAHPPEPGSLLVAHWGDLTPLWYYQQADGWRTDLLTANPPDDRWVDEWLKTDRPLYLAGALLDWAPGVTRHYQLTPWGELVRVSKNAVAPASPLKQTIDASFEGNGPVLRLTGFEIDHNKAIVGSAVAVNAYWTALDDIKPDDYVVSLSLSNDKATTHVQNLPLAVSWLPSRSLQKGQVALSNYRYTVPWGTPPGDYKLQLNVYALKAGRNLDIRDAGTSKDENMMTLQVTPPLVYPDVVPSDHVLNANLGQLKLLGYDGDISEVTAGDSRAIDLLWQPKGKLQSDLHVDFYLRTLPWPIKIGSGPLAANYPAEHWGPGEIIRDTQEFIIPADLAPGVYQLAVLAREGNKRLTLCEECVGELLGSVRVVGREHNFAMPAIEHPQTANFADRISLLGYALDASPYHPGDSAHMSLYWQGQTVMNTSYKFFLHVVDDKGKIWAQHDSFPGEGSSPTTAWLANEYATDTFEVALPQDMPPGRYGLRVGFYDPTTNQRLALNGTTEQADFVTLPTTLEVAP